MTNIVDSGTLNQPLIELAPPANNGKHPGGAPRIRLTDAGIKTVARMAAKGCSMSIIEDALGVSKGAFQAGAAADESNKFVTTYKKHFTGLQERLAHAQVAKALEGKDTTMQIWLGKQILGQRDTQQHEPAQPRQINNTQIIIAGDSASLADIMRAARQLQALPAQEAEPEAEADNRI